MELVGRENVMASCPAAGKTVTSEVADVDGNDDVQSVDDVT